MLWTRGQDQPSQIPDYDKTSTIPDVMRYGADDANAEKALEESEEFFC